MSPIFGGVSGAQIRHLASGVGETLGAGTEAEVGGEGVKLETWEGGWGEGRGR